jgi:hypothetical protein
MKSHEENVPYDTQCDDRVIRAREHVLVLGSCQRSTTMHKDEIIAEIWQTRDAFATRHRYNLDAMVEELRQLERQSPNKLVDRSGESVKKMRRRKRQRPDR